MENEAEAQPYTNMIINKSTTAVFTGHRTAKILAPDQKEGDLQRQIIQQLIPIIESLYCQGYRTFLSGMSAGFDLWAALAVILAKNSLSDINLISVIPFPDQQKSYSQQDKRLYDYLLQNSQSQILISKAATIESYLSCNDYMLEHSSHIIACYDGQPSGGTMYTLNQAKEQGHKITNVL